jgi:hypothetical protein
MKRYFFIHARVSEKEYRALNMLANHENTNVSEAIRLLIHQECERRGMPPGLIDFYRELPDPVSSEVPHGNCE